MSIEILTHHHSNGATLNTIDVQDLIVRMDSTWNPTKNPATKRSKRSTTRTTTRNSPDRNSACEEIEVLLMDNTACKEIERYFEEVCSDMLTEFLMDDTA